MKIGRKGFMLAEVVVISVVVATVLVTLYIGLNNIVSAYDTRNRYHDIDSLLVAIEINDILIRNIGTLDGTVNDAKGIIGYFSEDIDNAIQNFNELYSTVSGDSIISYITPYTSEDLLQLQSYDGRTDGTFSEFLNYLNGNFDFSADYDYIMIVERRENNNIDDCYYYALKLKY